jgi:NADPH:quinone reductase-like Zn-dependent oxidoreductase
VKAFVVDKYKKKGALVLVNMPEPELQDNDVLIRICATAVNQLDSKVRDGEFKFILPYRPPFILGHDAAGTVIKIGPQGQAVQSG